MSLTKSPKLTPMMEQVESLTARVEGAILFFRMGDFYEIFGKQAELVAPILGISLTSREKGGAERVAFCGVPHHSAKSYQQKLVRLGYKVAVAEQVEEVGASKGIVKRDIVRVFTPATVDDPEMLESNLPSYLIAVSVGEQAGVYDIVCADVSTGELRAQQGLSESKVVELISTDAPRELLCRRFELPKWKKILKKKEGQCSGPLLTALSEGYLREQGMQRLILAKVFGDQGMKSLQDTLPIGLLSAVLAYIDEMGASVEAFLRVRPLSTPDTFRLPENVIRDLELFETSRAGERVGSFIHACDGSKTPLGARLLRASLMQPMMVADKIIERRQRVSSLKGKGELWLIDLRKRLERIGDLERLSSRLASHRIKPVYLKKLALAACEVSQTADVLGESLADLKVTAIQSARLLGEKLLGVLISQPGEVGSGCGVFQQGFDTELDRLNRLSEEGDSQVDQYVAKLKQQTEIASLKVKRHKTFGLVLEVTRSNLHKVPEFFIRRQTMVNCERFVTSELKDLDEMLSQAESQAIERESQLYEALLETCSKGIGPLQTCSQLVAEWDMTQGLAWTALHWSYVEPKTLSDRDPSVRLLNSRHPVIEQLLDEDSFVANDIYLGKNSRQLLITGPNMAGKSTLMRQVALSAILHQIGGLVPADKAELPIFDGIYTRVGASDDLSRGLSTFMVEMSEASLITREATSNSLVILDELGRGTSSEDGLAIASAVLIHLSTRVKCWALFATHFHELAYLAAKLADAECLKAHVSREQDGKICFSHRISPGVSESSYGVEVAELAGLPGEVLKDARKTLDLIHQQNSGKKIEFLDVQASEVVRPARVGLSRPLFPTHPEERGFGLSAPIRKALKGLKDLNLDKTTPIEALQFLSKLQVNLQKEASK